MAASDVSYLLHCQYLCQKSTAYTNGICSECGACVMPNTKVVIESPLAGDFKKNQRYALWCAYDCYLRGESAYASHLVFTQFLDDKKLHERQFGIAAGFMWADHADSVVFYTDLGMSTGMEVALKRWQEKQRMLKTYESRQAVFRTLPKQLLEEFEKGNYPNNTFTESR